MNNTRHHAFTLIELMIVLGTIGILSGIVVTAVNPRHQLVIANNSKRLAAARELQQALNQYQIDPQHSADFTAFQASVPKSVALHICAPGGPELDYDQTQGCVHLNVLVTEDYIAALPIDVSRTNDALTGFSVTLAPEGQITTTAEHYVPGGNGGMMVPPGITSPQLIWYDPAAKTVFRRNLDGSGAPQVVIQDPTGYPHDALSFLGERVGNDFYWNIDGIDRVDLLTGQQAEILPAALAWGGSLVAIDPAAGYIYHQAEEYGFYRTTFAGNRSLIYSAETASAFLPAVDLPRNKVYFWGGTEGGNYSLRQRNLDGAEEEILEASVMPVGLALNGDYLYYMTGAFEPAANHVVKRLNVTDAVPTPEIIAPSVPGLGLLPWGQIQIDEQEQQLYVIGGEFSTMNPNPPPNRLLRIDIASGTITTLKTFTAAESINQPGGFRLDPIQRRLLWTQYAEFGQNPAIWQAALTDMEDGILSAEEVNVAVPGGSQFMIYEP